MFLVLMWFKVNILSLSINPFEEYPILIINSDRRIFL